MAGERLIKRNLLLLSQLTADFIKNKTGKGPKDIRANLIDNKVLIEMTNFLTPLERELAGAADGITNIKLAREKFYQKLSRDYHALAAQIMECRVLHSCSTYDVINDKAYILITLEREKAV